MCHFQPLHSNEPLHSHQERITNQIRNLEQELTLQTHAVDHFINKTEIRIAGRNLKNSKSSFSDKVKHEMIKSAVNELITIYPKLFNTVFKKVVLKMIPQTTVEYVFPVVLENYSVQFSTKDFLITL